MRALFLGSLAVMLVACAASNVSGPERVAVPDAPPQPVEIAKVEPAPEIPDLPAVPVPDRPDEDPDTIPLSGAWAATFGHTSSYAEAIGTAHKTHDAFSVASKSLASVDGGLPNPVDFQRANALMDLLNRRLAAAYYAPNATSEQRIAVLSEAASTLLAWSRQLDDMGLGVTPAAFKADHRIALTFEEVTEGPAKRWRGEGYALSKVCLERASSDRIDNAATKSCKQLHDLYKQVLLRGTAPPKTKAPAECSCNPGDPLCSSTMSGWCRPTK